MQCKVLDHNTEPWVSVQMPFIIPVGTDPEAAWLKYLSHSPRGLFHTVSSIIHHFHPDSQLLMRTPFVPTPSLSPMLHLSLSRTSQNPRLAHFVMGSSSLLLNMILFFTSSLPFPRQWIPSGYKHGLISSSLDGPSSGPICLLLSPPFSASEVISEELYVPTVVIPIFSFCLRTTQIMGYPYQATKSLEISMMQYPGVLSPGVISQLPSYFVSQ